MSGRCLLFMGLLFSIGISRHAKFDYKSNMLSIAAKHESESWSNTYSLKFTLDGKVILSPSFDDDGLKENK